MILPNVRTHLCKYRNELHGNHVSVFESRRGDEVAFDEGLISSQFRLEDRAEDRRLTFTLKVKDRRFGNAQLRHSSAAGRRMKSFDARKMNSDTRQRLAVTPRIRKKNQIQETMVET